MKALNERQTAALAAIRAQVASTIKFVTETRAMGLKPGRERELFRMADDEVEPNVPRVTLEALARRGLIEVRREVRYTTSFEPDYARGGFKDVRTVRYFVRLTEAGAA